MSFESRPEGKRQEEREPTLKQSESPKVILLSDQERPSLPTTLEAQQRNIQESTMSETSAERSFESSPSNGADALKEAFSKRFFDGSQASEISRYLPDSLLAFVVPLFFSVAAFLATVTLSLRHFGKYSEALGPLLDKIYWIYALAFCVALLSCAGKLSGAQRIIFNTEEGLPTYLNRLGKYYRLKIGLLSLGILYLIPTLGSRIAEAGAIGNLLYSTALCFGTAFGSLLIGRGVNKLIGAFQEAQQEDRLRRYLNPLLRNDKHANVIVEFDAFADLQRWIKRRFSQKSWVKPAFVGLLVICFMAFDGLHLLAESMTLLTKMLISNTGITGGAVGTASRSTGTGSFFLPSLFGIILSFIGFFIYSLYQVTHLQFSPEGLTLLYRRLGPNKKRLIRWPDVKELQLVDAKDSTLLSEKRLCFQGEKTRLWQFKLNCIESQSSRQKMLDAIERWAPALKRDAEVIQALQKSVEHSYTDLWLEALATPPKRDRLKPLVENSLLQDGRFRTIRQLGLGGQGTAYLAKDEKTEKEVVLKEFILPIYVDITVRRSALDRFEGEARILKHLKHPQIVQLIDFFVEDHRGYLALEYIQGEDLKKLVERTGKLPEMEVISLALQMAGIMQYLHGQDPPVIHRDFTPDNLILQPNGQLKLIDFNVAQQTDATITGTVVGKQCYLPPEQFQGAPTVQSDIYSFGATLQYLLTGSDPVAISQSSPLASGADVTAAMDLFVKECTALDSDLRYKNAADCLEALHKLAKEETQDKSNG